MEPAFALQSHPPPSFPHADVSSGTHPTPPGVPPPSCAAGSRCLPLERAGEEPRPPANQAGAANGAPRHIGQSAGALDFHGSGSLEGGRERTRRLAGLRRGWGGGRSAMGPARRSPAGEQGPSGASRTPGRSGREMPGGRPASPQPAWQPRLHLTPFPLVAEEMAGQPFASLGRKAALNRAGGRWPEVCPGLHCTCARVNPCLLACFFPINWEFGKTKGREGDVGTWRS